MRASKFQRIKATPAAAGVAGFGGISGVGAGFLVGTLLVAVITVSVVVPVVILTRETTRDTAFRFAHIVEADGIEVRIPTMGYDSYGGGYCQWTGYNITIDFGDGTNATEMYLAPDQPWAFLTHVYQFAGTYNVTIEGDIPALSYYCWWDKKKKEERGGPTTWSWIKIVDIYNWGTVVSQNISLEGLMANTPNAVMSATDYPNPSMTSYFRFCTSCPNITFHTDNWIMTNVTDITRIGCGSYFTDVSGWRFPKLKKARSAFACNNIQTNVVLDDWDPVMLDSTPYMFDGYALHNSKQNYSKWNTPLLTNIQGMYQGAVCSAPYVSGWKAPNVTNIGNMFAEYQPFDTVTFIPNLGGFLSQMTHLSNAENFLPYDTLGIAGLIDFSNITYSSMISMNYAFGNAISGDEAHCNKLNFTNADFSQVTSMYNTFLRTFSGNASCGGMTMQEMSDSLVLALANTTILFENTVVNDICNGPFGLKYTWGTYSLNASGCFPVDLADGCRTTLAVCNARHFLINTRAWANV